MDIATVVILTKNHRVSAMLGKTPITWVYVLLNSGQYQSRLLVALFYRVVVVWCSMTSSEFLQRHSIYRI